MISRGPQRPLILIMYILKDIVNITSTKLPSEKSQNYISTENMLPNKGGITPTAHVPQTGTVSIYQKGDTLISNIRPYFKKIWHARIEGTASNDILIFHPTEKVNDLYLYYLLSDDRFFAYVMTGAKGTKMPRGDKAQILQYPVSLPSLEEQKRIAGVLGAFDDKIELLQKQNTTLENMAKALFKSWFVDFGVVHAKQQGQPKAAVMQQYHLTEELYNLFPSSFEPSSLGPIPTGWQVKTAQEIANILIGRTPPRKESKWFSNNSKNHVWISIKDLGNCGIFINNSSEYLTEEAVNKFRIPMIPANTVVLSFKLTVGRVAISGRNMLSNEAIAQFQNSILPPSYLYFTLKNTNFSSLGSTSSIATAINSNTIKHMDILVANTQIIDIFTNEVEPLFNKIQTNNKQIQTLTEMRDALLPRLISGKIRV